MTDPEREAATRTAAAIMSGDRHIRDWMGPHLENLARAFLLLQGRKDLVPIVPSDRDVLIGLEKGRPRRKGAA